MISGQKIIVVMPAYNAESTLEATFNEIPHEVVDEVILVDDGSFDETIRIARKIGVHHIIEHDRNRGYGANQKSCYKKALELGADIVVMLHPDYQYDPKLIAPMCSIISQGIYPVVIGSRILGNGALKGGMPLYKYVANRALTFVQNVMIGQKLSEFHTGYRAYSRDVLEKVNFMENSNDFVFDNQILSQIFMMGYEVAEITCPTKYFDGASNISFLKSIRYGVGVLQTSVMHRLQRLGLANFKIYKNDLHHTTTY